MGGGFYGGFGSTAGATTSLSSGIGTNAAAMSISYPITRSGYFGTKGKNVRVIKSSTPEHSAIDFYTKITKGGRVEPLKNGHGTMTTLEDGTVIVYRPVTSTQGSPAVSIKVFGPSEIKSQKIHFVKGDS